MLPRDWFKGSLCMNLRGRDGVFAGGTRDGSVPGLFALRASRPCTLACAGPAWASVVWLFQMSESKRGGGPAKARREGFCRRGRISIVAPLGRSFGYCHSRRNERSAASLTKTPSAQIHAEAPSSTDGQSGPARSGLDERCRQRTRASDPARATYLIKLQALNSTNRP